MYMYVCRHTLYTYDSYVIIEFWTQRKTNKVLAPKAFILSTYVCTCIHSILSLYIHILHIYDNLNI